MNRNERKFTALLAGLAIGFCVVPSAFAMHIMEGYLPAGYCVAWGVLCIPFVAAGLFRIKGIARNYRKALLILAMAGAYTFVLSALKFPSVTGSSSHPTGTGLGAILFGPAPMAVIGLIVLLFQAILLAHGGLTSLGANTFSMAIAGPFVSYGIYKLCEKMKVNKKVSVFLAAALGNLFTYCVTSFQLGLAHPSVEGGVGGATLEFLGIFALTQIPLAIIEGLLTVVVFMGIQTYAKAELKEIGFAQEQAPKKKQAGIVAALLAVCVVLTIVPFVAGPQGAEFGGADDAAGQVVEAINPTFEPWAEPILEKIIGGELPGETESLLFCLQAAFGAGVVCYGFGYLSARKKFKAERS